MNGTLATHHKVLYSNGVVGRLTSALAHVGVAEDELCTFARSTCVQAALNSFSNVVMPLVSECNRGVAFLFRPRIIVLFDPT